MEIVRKSKNPSPQHKKGVSHFPSVSHIKTVKRPDESFSSLFFSVSWNWLSTHPQEFQFHDICGQGKALISAEILRKCYHISPQQKTCNWKFERGGNGLRHSSKTWLLDCSILNEDFFSWDHWSLPGAQRCRLLLCGSLQGAEDKKNEKWHCREAERSCCLQSIVYLDFLSSGTLSFILLVISCNAIYNEWIFKLICPIYIFFSHFGNVISLMFIDWTMIYIYIFFFLYMTASFLLR